MRRTLPLLIGLFLAGLFFWLMRDYGADRVPPKRAETASPAVASSDPKEPGDSLVVLYGREPDSLSPFGSTGITSAFELIDNLLPQLTWSRFEDCRLTYEPFLATGWEFSPDGLTLTYHLRKDVVWDDGVPATAADVAFSYDLLADDAVASVRKSVVSRMRRPPAEALDPHTVAFRFTEAYDRDSMMSHTGLNLVPKHLLEKADRKTFRGNPYGRAPVGTGPFKFGHWKPGEEVVLERNPQSKGRRVPLLDRVIVRQVPEPAAQIAAIRAGEADMLETIVESDVEPILETGDYRILRRGMRALEYVAWNNRNPLFSDRDVRRALTMAIDRGQLLETLCSAGGVVYGQPAIGTVAPLLCKAYASDVLPLPFNPAAAAALLDARGWTDSDGDGVREKAGKRFSFTLITNTGSPRRRREQELVRAMLAKVGVEAVPRDMPMDELNDRLRKRDFDAAVAGRSASLYIDLTPEWHSGEENAFNYASYANSQVDALIGEALREQEPGRAADLWKQVQRLIHEDQPFTFLYWRDLLVPIHKRFRDVRTNVLATLFMAEEWWVPRAQQKYRH
ncbi:MAG TPA: ABC transporter substrate-binding protein [Planctomycetota bacterium]|nr:ABC transporter substrate-binding protein [Planctomycetota bacterium]